MPVARSAGGRSIVIDETREPGTGNRKNRWLPAPGSRRDLERRSRSLAPRRGVRARATVNAARWSQGRTLVTETASRQRGLAPCLRPSMRRRCRRRRSLTWRAPLRRASNNSVRSGHRRLARCQRPVAPVRQRAGIRGAPSRCVVETRRLAIIAFLVLRLLYANRGDAARARQPGPHGRDAGQRSDRPRAAQRQRARSIRKACQDARVAEAPAASTQAPEHPSPHPSTRAPAGGITRDARIKRAGRSGERPKIACSRFSPSGGFARSAR